MVIDLIIKTKKGDSYELTLEEARELYVQLGDMFAPKELPPVHIPFPRCTKDDPLMPPYTITC